MTHPTQTDEANALVWETLPDPSYFDMHAVRTVGAAFTETMHLTNEDEAKWLVNHLNTIHTQLAEREAQLATERAMADRLERTIGFVTAMCEPDIEVKRATLQAYSDHKATRQPTNESRKA